jgi:hypothetical protein
VIFPFGFLVEFLNLFFGIVFGGDDFVGGVGA